MTYLVNSFAGSSSGKKKAIIGGVVGGVGFILVLGAIFLLYQRSKKPKAAKRGEADLMAVIISILDIL